MKDLYKRLGVPEYSPDAVIREALRSSPVTPPADAPPTAQANTPPDAVTRAAAASILLDPGRRAVYDRNHAILATIGTLRSRMGLNLRPFWTRGDFRDFTYLIPTARPARPTDPIEVIRAAGVGPPRRRRGRRHAVALVALLALLVLAAFVAWRVLRPG